MLKNEKIKRKADQMKLKINKSSIFLIHLDQRLLTSMPSKLAYYRCEILITLILDIQIVNFM